MFRRKHRDTEPTVPAASDSRRSSASLSSAFSLTKSLSEASLFNDNTNDAKGPLGLNLLHSPPEPHVDLIFIHGLGGGSRKTWSKTASPSHYWPQEWLPTDPAFKDVRIHSYGYDSDYLSGKGDTLNIHHLGKSFLGEVRTSPLIAQSQTYIITIGHSMGGLVIKKAIILARQDKFYQALASRFAAVYFLATPHRGADSAKILKNILRAVYDRAYVTDLERRSGSIQVINDEFRHFSGDLELWSFYETRNMKLFSSLVVDSESAVLGYREETQMPMTADHRSICKFESQSDANYIILRNALASTVGKVVEKPQLERKESLNQLGDLRRYLGVPGHFEDSYITAREARMSGSCQWITAKDSYVEWRYGTAGRHQILWIKGKPAAGKSVLAGYVIDKLQESGHDCSYFFFRHGDKTKSRLGACLRTLAFQMARTDPNAQNTILEMQREGVILEDIDDRTLWRVLFVSGIFHAIKTEQYWVIDALDECSSNSSTLFDGILSKLGESIPLRILVTSRDSPHLDQSFSGLPQGVVRSLSISITDTLTDIRHFVESKTESLSIIGLEDRSLLAEKIISKSQGSFLWTILVLGELRGCHSKREIAAILEEVPGDMGRLYKRILDIMSQSARGKVLAKAVLAWTTCAVRPMSIDELGGALSLDIEDTFPKLRESISSLCGQFVSVDRFGNVQMVHETAREFLLAENLDSEFAVDKRRTHTRIAEGCLKYLIGEEMKPPRTTRRRTTGPKRSSFANYVYTAYSYHLSRADPHANDLFEFVGQFLKSNILAWIEAVARSSGPGQLISASRHLRMYYDACCSERSPLHPMLRSLKQWTADLARIAVKFATPLKALPSAIYSLIPPLCPTESMIHEIGGSGRKITILGGQKKEWDDRISCVDFREGQPSALCYGDKFLAIGLTKGTVALYDSTSYQEHSFLNHGEAVKFIRFKDKTNIMTTCGMKLTKVWDARTGELIHSVKSPPRPLDVGFYHNLLLVASHQSYIAGWDLDHDARPVSDKWWTDSPDLDIPLRGRSPCALSISPSHKMLAVSYSGQPITLWDLQEDAYYGSCGKKLPNGETGKNTVVLSLAFNPNPNIGLMAVTYLDGDLALLDPFADEQLECFRANCQALGASPDGRFLVAGGGEGIINVYEFDTLRLLYRVKSYNSFIKQLGFAKDSLHIADIRAAQCSVWEPTALMRYSLNDGSTGTTSASIVNTVLLEATAKITVIAVHHTPEVTFAGRDDGAVLLYCGKTASCLRMLYSHKSPIRFLVWCQSRNALLSIDGSNRIFMYRVQKAASKDWLVDPTMLFQSHLSSGGAVVDVLLGEEAGKFMVSTRDSDHLFDLDGSHHEKRAHNSVSGSRKWILHPGSPLHMVCFDEENTCTVYHWGDWSEVWRVPFPTDNDIERIKNLDIYTFGRERRILLGLSEGEGSRNMSKIMVLPEPPVVAEGQSSDGQGEVDAGPSNCRFGNTKEKGTMASITSFAALHTHELAILSPNIAHIIGLSDTGRLVFLDLASWVCSTDLGVNGLGNKLSDDSSTVGYSRHFYVPYDWFAGRRDIVWALAQRDLLFARGGDLVIVRGWLEHTDRVNLQ